MFFVVVVNVVVNVVDKVDGTIVDFIIVVVDDVDEVAGSIVDVVVVNVVDDIV